MLEETESLEATENNNLVIKYNSNQIVTKLPLKRNIYKAKDISSEEFTDIDKPLPKFERLEEVVNSHLLSLIEYMKSISELKTENFPKIANYVTYKTHLVSEGIPGYFSFLQKKAELEMKGKENVINIFLGKDQINYKMIGGQIKNFFFDSDGDSTMKGNGVENIYFGGPGSDVFDINVSRELKNKKATHIIADFEPANDKICIPKELNYKYYYTKSCDRNGDHFLGDERWYNCNQATVSQLNLIKFKEGFKTIGSGDNIAALYQENDYTIILAHIDANELSIDNFYYC
jgi:hypothetical protein